MNRIIKNILMIILLLVLIGLNIYLINNQVRFSPNEIQREEFNKQNMNPPRDDNMGEPPAKPEENNSRPMQERDKVTSNYIYIFLILDSISISLIVMYLIMSKFNANNFKETFKSTDKIIIYLLSTIVMTIIILGIDFLNNNPLRLNDENTEKDTKPEDVESGKDVKDNLVNLDDYNSNITITEAKSYTLTGSFEHSILVNAKGTVTLNLKNVTVNSKITAAIANISQNKLIINLEDETTNVLTDSGSSEYDGCIYSSGPLTITGNGKLTVNGRQKEGEGIATTDNDITINGGHITINSVDDGLNAGGDNGGIITINGGTIYINASGDGIDSNNSLIINEGIVYTVGSSLGGDAGIDTDKGFTINGGTVIALGSDMLETPLKSSKQNSLCFNLNSRIDIGTLVTLLDENDQIIISFEAIENFKTLILSSPSLKKGTYSLYVNGTTNGTKAENIFIGGSYTKGTKIIINNQDRFVVNNIVNKFGNK